jgi:hypothetical protein
MLTALRITIFISLYTKSKNQCNLNGGFYLAKLGHIYLALLINNYLKYILPTSPNRTDLSIYLHCNSANYWCYNTKYSASGWCTIIAAVDWSGMI